MYTIEAMTADSADDDGGCLELSGGGDRQQNSGIPSTTIAINMRPAIQRMAHIRCAVGQANNPAYYYIHLLGVSHTTICAWHRLAERARRGCMEDPDGGGTRSVAWTCMWPIYYRGCEEGVCRLLLAYLPLTGTTSYCTAGVTAAKDACASRCSQALLMVRDCLVALSLMAPPDTATPLSGGLLALPYNLFPSNSGVYPSGGPIPCPL